MVGQSRYNSSAIERQHREINDVLKLSGSTNPSKAQGELRGEKGADVSSRILFMLEAVLQLELCVGGKAVPEGGVDSPQVITPRNMRSLRVGDLIEELLIPS